MQRRHTSDSSLLATFVFLLSFLPTNMAAQGRETVRWKVNQPDCEFSRNQDGTYRYAVATGGLTITMAVDSQELDRVRQRVEPVIAIFLSVKYSGSGGRRVDPNEITLEFVDHFHTVQGVLDKDRLAALLNGDARAMQERAGREIQKHPEKKKEIEAALSSQREAIARMIDFLRSDSLSAATLRTDNPVISGWIFLSARNRWIHELNRQEGFVLRVPIDKTIVEFPFTLPLSQADIDLRVRPRE